MHRYKLSLLTVVVMLALLACSISTGSDQPTGAQADPAAADTPTNKTTPAGGDDPIATSAPAAQTQAPRPAPVQPSWLGADEPVLISGDIPYTSPFFLNSTSEPFVMLEDQAGFVQRDREFLFALEGQTIGPVKIDSDQKLTYSLPLPAVPQATYLDVDNDGQSDTGVQIFQVAYWSNTWGDAFLEERDGKGWSSAYNSARTDPEKDEEIVGGLLVVWAPDDLQGFPTGFGADGKLFTEDDPTGQLPAGYSLVNLDQEPFEFTKEPNPQLTLNEGVGAVKDYSQLGYGEAFQAMFEKVAREYPFTAEKNVDWDSLSAEFLPRAAEARNDSEFYRLLREFANRIPDGHIGFSFNNDVFFEDYGGGLGMNLALLSNGKLIVTEVLPNLPGADAGIQAGAEILSWNGDDPATALDKVVPGFGPYSTDHTRRQGQVQFLTRTPAGTSVQVTYANPGGASTSATLTSTPEYDSLLRTLPGSNQDELGLPIEGSVLDDSGLGYIRINTFSDDYNMMARLWDHFMQSMIDNEVPGLIIDLRTNSGGSMGMAFDFAGYFFDREIPLYDNFYYNDNSGQFEKTPYPARILPAPLYYDGPITILVSTNCVSACEGFSYAMQQDGRATIIGHTPTAGAFGEVGLGQYKLPGDFDGQFPTGKSVAPEGAIVIEGQGVIPDILIPVTLESALGQVDALLLAAIQALR